MTTIYLIHPRAFAGQFTPMTTLDNARLEYHTSWSTSGGGTLPVYRNPVNGLWVTSIGWSEADVFTFAALWSAKVTTVELPDEEADAVIAKLNSNLIGSSPT